MTLLRTLFDKYKLVLITSDGHVTSSTCLLRLEVSVDVVKTADVFTFRCPSFIFSSKCAAHPPPQTAAETCYVSPEDNRERGRCAARLLASKSPIIAAHMKILCSYYLVCFRLLANSFGTNESIQMYLGNNLCFWKQ